MKVLIVSLFHPELVRGGAQRVAYELFLGLRAMPGIEPTLLASIDESQATLYKSGARITGFDGRPGEFLFLSRFYDNFWHRSSSATMAEHFVEFIDLIKPDVIHFHHFLTFGIDFLSLARRTFPAVRIAFTLHEFLLICHADGHMLRRFDNSLCTGASAIKCHQCFPNIRPEQFFLRELWLRRHLETVDVFTTPSRFMIGEFVQWGLPRDKIVHVSNGQRDYSEGRPPPAASTRRNRFGFFGQLVDIKGVHILLEAVQHLREEEFLDFVIEINGDNLRFASEKRRTEIEEFLTLEEEKPVGERNVIFNGSYSPDQMRQRMSRVDWCVVPSVWKEVFALVISEAWMFGRPVIASNVGGPEERVRDDVDGLHFQVGDAISLAETIKRACLEDGLWERLRGNIVPPLSRETMCESFVEIYRTLAPDAAKPAPPALQAPAAPPAPTSKPVPPPPPSPTAAPPAVSPPPAIKAPTAPPPADPAPTTAAPANPAPANPKPANPTPAASPPAANAPVTPPPAPPPAAAPHPAAAPPANPSPATPKPQAPPSVAAPPVVPAAEPRPAPSPAAAQAPLAASPAPPPPATAEKGEGAAGSPRPAGP